MLDVVLVTRGDVMHFSVGREGVVIFPGTEGNVVGFGKIYR